MNVTMEGELVKINQFTIVILGKLQTKKSQKYGIMIFLEKMIIHIQQQKLISLKKLHINN